MSSTGNWHVACQWGSGEPNEIAALNGPWSTYSAACNAPESPPAAGPEMGSYALDYPMAQTTNALSQQFGYVQKGGTSFYIRPKAGGQFTGTAWGQVFGVDDGTANGLCLGWKGASAGSDAKSLSVMSYISSTPLAISSLAAMNESETYHGVTNPWWCIQIYTDKTAQTATFKFYKWNEDDGDFDLIDTIGVASSSFSYGHFFRIGNNLSGGTGTVQIANLRTIEGAGLYGDPFCNMASGVPTTLEATTTQWVKEDGTNDATLGAGGTEYPKLTEVPSNDSTYLKSSSSIGTQFYQMTSGLIPAGENVLAVKVSARFNVPGASASSCDIFMRVNTGTSVGMGGAASLHAGLTQHLNLTKSVQPSGAGWSITNVDDLQTAHGGARNGVELRITQLIYTVAWGPDAGATSGETFSESREQTILAVGELSDTGTWGEALEQIILAVLEESDGFQWDEILEQIVLVVLEESDGLEFGEDVEQIILAVLSLSDYLTWKQQLYILVSAAAKAAAGLHAAPTAHPPAKASANYPLTPSSSNPLRLEY